MDEWISDGYPRVSDDQATALVAAVQDIDVRDTAWCQISDADARHHVDLWRQIATRADGPTVLPVLGLLAVAAWISGNGTLANIALDRADRTQGSTNYSLIRLARQTLEAGMPPTEWAAIRAGLAQELTQRYR